MKITLVGKGIDLTQALKDRVDQKMLRLDKYFTNETEAFVTLSTQKNQQKIEVTIPVKGNIIRAEYETQDMYEAIDLVLDILERQVRKYRNKIQSKKYAQIAKEAPGNFIDLPMENSEPETLTISKVKTFDIKPMTPEEACLQMELLNHNFFVFNNALNGKTEVVYKRKNGSYGLIAQE